MAWIESHQELGRHPKTRRAAKLLGVSRAAVIGHLHYLWWWALDYAQDGVLTAYDADEIAEACLWDGEPSALVDGLVAVGFLDCDEDGTLHIHGWLAHEGKVLRRLAAEAERSRLSPMIRRWVIERDGLVCGICGHPVAPDDVHIDHIMPVSRGGQSTLDNLRVTHSACNMAKGNALPEERQP